MATADKEQLIDGLYVTLKKQYETEDYAKALSTAKKITRTKASDALALQCAVICHIQLEGYEEALALIKKKKIPMHFEMAYCLYRLGRPLEGLEALQQGAGGDEQLDVTPRVKELRAQCLFKLDRFSECLPLYEDLLKNVNDSHDDERLSNYLAALTSLAQQDASTPPPTASLFSGGGVGGEESCVELLYNRACLLIVQGKWELAEKLLLQSIKLCETLYTEDEDERNDESAPSRVQLAYVYQCTGRPSEAQQMYSLVHKTSSGDLGLAAVIANNLLVASKTGNVFESKKRIKVMTQVGSEKKLTKYQREMIACNLCLYSLATNQLDVARRKFEEIHTDYPHSSLLPLLNVALLVRDKKAQAALQALESLSGYELVKAQIFLSQGNLLSACKELSSSVHRHTLGVAGALAKLYFSLNHPSTAKQVINETADWYKTKNDNDSLSKLLRQGAALMTSSGDHRATVELLERLLAEVPGSQDPTLISQIIAAAVNFDPLIAKKYTKSLPSIDQLSRGLDVNKLMEESEALPGNRYTARRTQKPLQQIGEADMIVKKKNKRKKKTRLPKNYDPSNKPDPERWLPKWERSTYRRKKKHRHQDIGRGTQGTSDSAPIASPANGPGHGSTTPVDSPKPGGGGSQSSSTAGGKQRQDYKKKKGRKR